MAFLFLSCVCGLAVSLALCGLFTIESRVPASLRIAGASLLLTAAAFATVWVIPDAGTLPAFLGGAALGVVAMRGEGLASFTAAIGGSRLWIYLLSVVSTAGLVYLFVPVTTFLTSPGELGIHLDYLVTNNARDAVAIVYVAAAFYALAPSPRTRTALTLLALGVLSLTLLYTYVLPFGYPMLSGLVFEQVALSDNARVLRLVVDIVALVLVVLALRAGLRRFGGRPFLVGLLLVNFALVSVAFVGIRRDTDGGAGGRTETLSVKPLRFSRTQPNVLYVFLDRFMGSYVEGILEREPLMAQRLQGFTWYARSVSAGQNSIAGVHPMLGGYDYTPLAMNARNRRLRDLSVEAFSILPVNFSRAGYQVNVVSPRGLGFTMAGDCRFLKMPGVLCTHIPKSVTKTAAVQMGFPLLDLAKSDYTELLLLLGAMRTAPYSFKELLLRRGEWRRLLDHSAGTTFSEWAELRAWPSLSDTNASGSNMNFVSNILPHEPYYLGEDCQPQSEKLTATEDVLRARGHASVFSWQHEVAAQCTLRLVADYLDFLKEAGVYDNTRIIIVSDHGIVGKVNDVSSRAIAGGTSANEFVRTRSVLLVKPRGARGPLVTSEQFMPNAEAPRIACEEIGGCVNPFLANKPITAQGRDDPFAISIVPWQFNKQNRDSFVIQEQYELRGKDPYDAANWQRVEP